MKLTRFAKRLTAVINSRFGHDRSQEPTKILVYSDDE
jgi:hypothetical protein